jgi:hypothetical protein
VKKICTLLVFLVLAGFMGSCTKFETYDQCRSDCDSRFRDNAMEEKLLYDTIFFSVYNKELCYNRCDRKF